MFTKSLITATVTDKFEKEYALCISLPLEEKLKALISKKYDLDEWINIESFAFLGQVVVVSDDNGYQYTIPYSEL